jgi:hypothetical protein
MSRNKKEVRKLNVEELKSVVGGGVHEVPGMKRFPRRVPVHAKRMKR